MWSTSSDLNSIIWNRCCFLFLIYFSKFPNLHLRQPEWTSINDWNWSRESMECTMKSGRFFESTGNWLKCPEEPRINLPGIAERESVCVRGRGRGLLHYLAVSLVQVPACKSSRHILCLALERKGCFQLDNVLASFSSFSFIWPVWHCTSSAFILWWRPGWELLFWSHVMAGNRLFLYFIKIA